MNPLHVLSEYGQSVWLDYIQRYQELYRSARWQALAIKGAQTQRLLWASTSTKNPNYRDVLYVEELIGSDTVNTIPAATFDAFRDHGRPRASLQEHLAEARDTIKALQQSGISLQETTDTLLDEGVKLFAEAFDKLLNAMEKKRQALLGNALQVRRTRRAADRRMTMNAE